ncbi:hypothetical protein ACLB2K_076689 [Fragaria x ananassa]
MVLSSLFLCFRGKNNGRTESNYADFIRVSYITLSEATDSFSSENLVGVGSFGSVYKVVLVVPSHGAQLVAVKVFKISRWGASNSFTAECEMFRNIRHRNIVKIVTTCSSVDFRGNDFKALVYEFMENGSLEEWLHPKHGAQNPPKNLNLFHRLDIAIDVACALDYLHNHCKTPVVHCDLKPANVLLDDELNGRVSDFGLARFLSKTSKVAANQSSSRGSVGYIAPEYKKGSEASTYGDVYSFGILLLEMFTGKKPSDHMFRDDWNLRTYVEMALFEGSVIEIADSRLFLQEDNNDSATKYCARVSSDVDECCLRLIFGIGILCSNKSPKDRKDMGYVVTELQSTRNVLMSEQYGLARSSKIYRIDPLKPPRSDWVKVNTDGVWRKGLGVSGYGGVFKNHQGRFIGAFSSSLDIPSSVAAKVMAVIKAIELAWISDWKYVWLEVDSQIVLDLLRSPMSAPLQLHVLWKNCLYRISMMDFRCSHIYREGNQIANALASFGISSSGMTWWNTPPDFIRSLYDRDKSRYGGDVKGHHFGGGRLL